MHRLTRVEVEHVPDPVGERGRVWRLLLQPLFPQPLPFGAASIQPFAVAVPKAGLLDVDRRAGAHLAAEPLPLGCQQAVALEIAEGAVVGHDFEPVPKRLEAPTGLVATVGTLAHE